MRRQPGVCRERAAGGAAPRPQQERHPSWHGVSACCCLGGRACKPGRPAVCPAVQHSAVPRRPEYPLDRLPTGPKPHGWILWPHPLSFLLFAHRYPLHSDSCPAIPAPVPLLLYSCRPRAARPALPPHAKRPTLNPAIQTGIHATLASIFCRTSLSTLSRASTGLRRAACVPSPRGRCCAAAAVGEPLSGVARPRVKAGRLLSPHNSALSRWARGCMMRVWLTAARRRAPGMRQDRWRRRPRLTTQGACLQRVTGRLKPPRCGEMRLGQRGGQMCILERVRHPPMRIAAPAPLARPSGTVYIFMLSHCASSETQSHCPTPQTFDAEPDTRCPTARGCGQAPDAM